MDMWNIDTAYVYHGKNIDTAYVYHGKNIDTAYVYHGKNWEVLPTSDHPAVYW